MHIKEQAIDAATKPLADVSQSCVSRIIEGIFETFPDLRFDGRRMYVRDDLVVQEWTATATHSRPITRGGRTYGPSGKKMSWIGMDVIPLGPDALGSSTRVGCARVLTIRR